jgi:hypothetical protein
MLCNSDAKIGSAFSQKVGDLNATKESLWTNRLWLFSCYYCTAYASELVGFMLLLFVQT